MLLDNIPSGLEVFLDANVLVFYFGPDPVYGPPCQRLLERIEQQDVAGVTSVHVLSEAMHRAMTIEAIAKHNYPVNGIGQRLRRRPTDIQGLTRFRTLGQKVFDIGVRVLPIEANLVDRGAEISQQLGLLTNDALIVALMRERGLSNLASHDADFDRVPSVVRYSPV
jgi:predicted nucleic acid-binding protein